MKKLILLLALISLNVVSNAQITITSEEYLAAYSTALGGTTDEYDSEDMTGVTNLMALKGPGANWDFGSRTYTKTTTTNDGVSLVDVATAPLHNDPDFAGATHCIKVDGETSTDYDYYSYVKITSDGFYSLGSVEDSAGMSVKSSSYVPPLQQMKFPLTYGTMWSSTSTVKTPYSFPGSSTTSTYEVNCDGWGTIQTPTRTYKKNDPTSSTNCLRIRAKTTNTTSFGSVSFNIVSHLYEWITEGSVNASVFSDTNDIPMYIGYTQAGATGSVSSELDAENVLKMTISSNPAHTQTFLGYSLPVHGNVQVSLMNALGSEVTMLHNGPSPAGKNSVKIDPTTLSNGTYFIRVVTDGYSATRKLVIAK